MGLRCRSSSRLPERRLDGTRFRRGLGDITPLTGAWIRRWPRHAEVTCTLEAHASLSARFTVNGEGNPISEPDASRDGAVRFEGGNPIFRVKNLAESLDYYVRVLGFEIDWQEPGVIASVSRGRFTLFLCEGDQGNPGAWVWVGVADAGALLEEYRARGARVRHPPTNYVWAYEMQVEDPDGNVLRLGSEPKADRPVGEWLDTRGQAWARSPEGNWTRVAPR